MVVSFFLVLGVDAASKAYVHASIPYMGFSPSDFPYGGIGLFQGFLGGVDCSINHVVNTGAAWSLLKGYPQLLLPLRLSLIVLLALYLFFFNKERAYRFPLILILAGAVGNVMDTFCYGAVIDFVHVQFWGWSYPLFNAADSALFCGAALLIGHSFVQRKNKKRSFACELKKN